MKPFLLYLALDVTTYCIREIHCLALDGFDINTIHKLRSKEKNSQEENCQRGRDSDLGLLDVKQECNLCAIRNYRPKKFHEIGSRTWNDHLLSQELEKEKNWQPFFWRSRKFLIRRRIKNTGGGKNKIKTESAEKKNFLTLVAAQLGSVNVEGLVVGKPLLGFLPT